MALRRSLLGTLRTITTMSGSNPTLKITLHYIPIPASRVDRLIWLLEELELKYDVKAHPLVGPVSPGMQKVTKLGKVCTDL